MAAYDEIARTGQALLESLAAADPPVGQLDFWWLGQHTFILKIGSTRVFIDPYLKPSEARAKPPLLTPDQCADFDLVLLTHDHSDHIDPWAIPGIAAASRAEFVSPAATRQRLLDLGVPPERWHGLDPDESVSLCGLTITAIKAAHEFFHPTPEGHFPFLGYIIDGPGIRAWHAGDTLWWEGLQAKLREHLPLDVVFVPINGRDAERYTRQCWGNLNFAEAVDLIGPLAPGLAVPSHFDMFRGNSENPLKFTDYLTVKYPGVPFWLGPAGEPFRVIGRR